MRQEEFLKMLEKALGRLKKSDRLKYVESYRELLADMMENGFSEEEAVARQGDVKTIAAEIIAGAAPNEKRKDLGGAILLIASTVMLVLSAVTLFNDRIISRILTAIFNIGAVDASTIGVIGGADGPTAIFVTTHHAPWYDWLVFLSTAVTIGATVLYFVRKRKK